jgi:excisionase family DNA binding protein
MTSGEYITTVEVAKLLKISASTVTRMAREGRLSALKVGKLWRFPAQSPGILLYKQEQKVVRHSEKAGSAESPGPQKNGIKEFLKLATDLGLAEPFARDTLYEARR